MNVPDRPPGGGPTHGWEHVSHEPGCPPWPPGYREGPQNIPFPRGASPLSYVRLFLNSDVLDMIIDETNLYAHTYRPEQLHNKARKAFEDSWEDLDTAETLQVTTFL